MISHLRFGCFVLLLFLIGATTLPAADSPVLGTWRLAFPVPTQQGEIKFTFVLMFSESEGKAVCDFIGMSPKLNVEPTVNNVVIKDTKLKFTMNLADQKFTFDGQLNKDNKKIAGSWGMANSLMLVEMMPSKLNKMDEFAFNKELLDMSEGGNEFFDALFPVLNQATSKKLKLEEVRAITDKANKTAEMYGPRWQRNIATRLASTLVNQETFIPIALEQARQAERMLSSDDDVATQMSVLESLSRILKKAKKEDDAKKVDAQLTKLETRDYLEYTKKQPIKIEPYEGRRGKSDRVLLVELFTGAECPPCVATDVAFDGMLKTFKATDVVFLQYHLHIPRFDPLTNPDCEARQNFYGDKIRGTPSIFFNGRKDNSGGGPLGQAKAKYRTYREMAEEELEKVATVKLTASASKKGEEIQVKANVSNLEKPGEKTSLRFALVEDRVRYEGGNGLRYHHAVVRAFPGGPKGFALTKKDSEHTAGIKLPDLRTDLNKYLDKASEEDEPNNPDRPMAFRGLKLVAFVQDDDKQEILNAIQVEVSEER